jgi:hypothetical protein
MSDDPSHAGGSLRSNGNGNHSRGNSGNSGNGNSRTVAASRHKRLRLRSRNKVIDHWLDEEDGSDTFADLEDFIVA